MSKNKYMLEFCKYSKHFIVRIHELNQTAKKYNCDIVDVSFIEKGLAFAKHYHQRQFRKSGEPYVSHPIAVASMVADHMFRENVIIAALLHDTAEDTTLTLSEIESEFSPRIAEMVDRLTRKIDPATGKKMSAGECLIKARELGDDEVALIKSCDRWHNMETIDSLSDIKKEKIALETLEYFSFLGSSLDMKNIEIELSKISKTILNEYSELLNTESSKILQIPRLLFELPEVEESI